ncbi:sulfur carrier protein ThiS [Pontibacter sp. G13]|uniref:sulfur carrier protein ThiS n=1 Tax=Pontibacter sp. G13 TaxID=3074898 RepID=UPI00288BDAB4|nr:sulfur carrier protein ThiS [Pontibacter sp. G13]WNJ18965.1 sulfur carrier protein ThiS [Pontibacter sp. G13]
MIELFVNDKPHQLPNQVTVQQLLESLNLADGHGIAVAVNEQVIPRGNWGDTVLNSQDKVMVITATQGG